MCLYKKVSTHCMNQILTLPTHGANVQEIDGIKYLVARLEETRTCEWYISELKQGKPVVVPHSKRGHLIGLLKAQGIFTKSKTLVIGQWISFVPCEQREFRD